MVLLAIVFIGAGISFTVLCFIFISNSIDHREEQIEIRQTFDPEGGSI